jgi:hypothetical protein
VKVVKDDCFFFLLFMNAAVYFVANLRCSHERLNEATTAIQLPLRVSPSQIPVVWYCKTARVSR